MKNVANFISLEETDKDLIISFAIDNYDTSISSLILHRTLFYEEILPEEERGVHVTYESDSYEQEDFNMLININISDKNVFIDSTFRKYTVDISKIEKEEISEMLKLLSKQNHDKKFLLQINSIDRESSKSN